MNRWIENGFDIRRDMTGGWSAWVGDTCQATFGSLRELIGWINETR